MRTWDEPLWPEASAELGSQRKKRGEGVMVLKVSLDLNVGAGRVIGGTKVTESRSSEANGIDGLRMMPGEQTSQGQERG